VEGEAGATRMAARTPDMAHTVPLIRLRYSRTTEAIRPHTASVARAGGWAEVSGDEAAVGVVVEDVDDGSYRNECSALVEPNIVLSPVKSYRSHINKSLEKSYRSR
jgi:hypothetical protein